MKILGRGNQGFGMALALALLAGCGGSQPPIGEPDATIQRYTIVRHQERTTPPNYLYVADPLLHAILAFDSSGNTIAEKKFANGQPVDVVTDSRGHVYADVYMSSGFCVVIEYTHMLDREIRKYPTGFISTIAIDTDDNLYVDYESTGGFYQDIVRYPYGSTKMTHTYIITSGEFFRTDLTGISARKNELYAMVVAPPGSFRPPLTIRCPLSGSRGCGSEGKGAPRYATCGFTTTSNNHQVYGVNLEAKDQLEYDTIGKHWPKWHHDIELPPSYGFGNVDCHFHGYKNKIWVGVQSRSGPSEVLEVDIARGKVLNTIGAGIVDTPEAAYYGNGLTP